MQCQMSAVINRTYMLNCLILVSKGVGEKCVCGGDTVQAGGKGKGMLKHLQKRGMNKRDNVMLN